MQKRIAMAASLMICTLGSALAQIEVSKLITGNQTSPEAITSIRYGAEGELIWIFYHAPSVKGRHIFNGTGALQPDGTVWRFGADDATVLHTDADLDIGGWQCRGRSRAPRPRPQALLTASWRSPGRM